MPTPIDVAIIGAGPYGLSIAAHLRGARRISAHLRRPASRESVDQLARATQ